MLGSMLGIAFGSGACYRSPEIVVERARGSAQGAIRALRSSAPDDARRLEQLLSLAERAEVQRSRSWRGGRSPEPSSAWMETLREARAAVAASHRHRLQLEHRWREALVAAEAAVGRARLELESPGMAREEAALLASAVSRLERARAFADGGGHKRAIEEAGRAVVASHRVGARWRELHARFSDPTLKRSWSEWAEETIAASRRSGNAALVVDKLGRRLVVYSRGEPIDEFPVELGTNGLAPKRQAGDRATPEGRYRVSEIRTDGATRFYKALLIDYPNAEDRRRFERLPAAERPPAGLGGLIEIHGKGGRGRDWTDGCIALTNSEMDRLVPYVSVGTSVTIVGTYE